MMAGPDDVTLNVGGTTSGAIAANEALIASYEALRASAMALADTFRVASAQMSEAGLAFARMGEGATALQGQLAAVRTQQSGMAAEMAEGNGIIAAMQGFSNGVRDAIGQVTGFIKIMAGLWVLQEGIGLFDQMIDRVESLAKSIFQLNVNTERMVYMWQYQYASKGKPDPKIASAISAWTAQFSFNAPFTRQDIMSGIGALGPTGLNLQGLQRYAPLIADLASTHASIFTGGGQLTFSQVAFAVMEAMKTGYMRRFLMELQIQPRALEKYGVKFLGHGHMGGQVANPWQFLPALEAYSKAQGWTGAANRAAHETFWGEWSSFIDRMQNMGLQLGGMSLEGKVRKGSPFGTIKSDLEAISAWIDGHKSQLYAFADLIAKTVGGAFQTAGDAASHFLSGLGESGLGHLLSGFLGPDEATKAAQAGPTKPTKPIRAAFHTREAYQAALEHYKQALKKYQHDEQVWQHQQQIHQRHLQHASRYETLSAATAPTESGDAWTKLGKALGDAAAQAKRFADAFLKIYGWLTNGKLQEGLNDLNVAWYKFQSSFSPEEWKALTDALGLVVYDVAILANPTGGLHMLAGALDGAANAVQELNNEWDTTRKNLQFLKVKIDGFAADLNRAGVGWGTALMQGFIEGISSQIPQLQGILDAIKGAAAGGVINWGGGSGANQSEPGPGRNAPRRRPTRSASLARIPGGLVRPGALGGIY